MRHEGTGRFLCSYNYMSHYITPDPSPLLPFYGRPVPRSSCCDPPLPHLSPLLPFYGRPVPEWPSGCFYRVTCPTAPAGREGTPVFICHASRSSFYDPPLPTFPPSCCFTRGPFRGGRLTVFTGSPVRRPRQEGRERCQTSSSWPGPQPKRQCPS